MVSERTSAMFLPRYVTSRVCRLYREPLHTSHSTNTSGRKCISIFFTPWPWHASHRPPLTLKLEPPRCIPADARLFHLRKDSSDIIKKPCIRRWVRARRPPDRALVNLDHTINLVQPVDARMLPRRHPRPKQILLRSLQQNIIHQRALARTRHTRDTHHAPHGKAMSIDLRLCSLAPLIVTAVFR